MRTTADDVSRAAIMSMYKAAEFGVNSYAFFTEAFENPEAENYYCTRILRNAVESDMEGLFVRYTPVYSTEDSAEPRKIISCEASLALSSLSPEEAPYPSYMLMQIAERMGVDVASNAWIIKQACEFCKRVQAGAPDFKVCVNATSRTLSTGTILTLVKNALYETGLLPESLSVQFSERIVAIHYDRFISVLGELKKLGVPVIIDNVGSYYTVTSLLRHSGINAIKADITIFTGNIDEFSEAYLKNIKNLADSNNVSIGVKSVEDKAQLEAAPGVDWYQGSSHSNEISSDEILRLMVESKQLVISN